MRRKYGWLIVATAAIAVVLVLAISASSDKRSTNSDGYLTAVRGLRDVHGLAVDVADSNKLWIANHNGLYLLKDEKDLFAVGDKRDDYMGFSIHPTDTDTFFTSGHPARGGNIGIQKTTDGGRTWQKLSNGVNGPVDFHTMAVSQVNPEIMYGSYSGQLQRSTDGGRNWQLLNNAPQAIALATSPAENDTVFAATQTGLQVSTDQGNTWAPTGRTSAVYAVAFNPTNSKELLASHATQGLVKSSDGGVTWQALNNNITEVITFIAFDKSNPQTLYVVDMSLGLHKSTDGGVTWRKVRQLNG